nr:IS1182 family transposase [Gayadomonas joobiniege]
MEHKLDLSVFYPKYKNDENGRPAYDPAVLLKIILFAYSKGITSSRQIQWCCETNIIFKALSCDSVPHYTTIAAFVSGRSQEIENLFEQILLICHQQGLLGNELFAIDGCKMSSNAAKEWSGTFKELEQKLDKIKRQLRHYLNKHQAEDNNEQTTEDAQQKRHAQMIATLNQAHDKIDKFLNTNKPRQGRRNKEVKSNITDNQSAKMTTSKGTIQGYNGLATVDKKHQIIVDAQAFGEGQEHYSLQPILNAVKARYKRLNISDNIYQTGTIVTADTGFANEANMKYLHENQINGYIPDNQFRSRDPKFSEQKTKYGKRHQDGKNKKRKQTIPASEFDFDPTALSCTCPSGERLSFRGIKDNGSGLTTIYFEGRLLQCRHCPIKSHCMHNPDSANHRKGNGRQVSFSFKNDKKPNYTDWMKHRVDSEKGKHIYSHRMSTVEPVFANIGTQKRLHQFSLRGQTKVQGQWQLYCLVHNIEKLTNYGTLSH